MKPRGLVAVAGVPPEIGDEFVAGFARTLPILSWVPLNRFECYTKSYATKLYERVALNLPASAAQELRQRIQSSTGLRTRSLSGKSGERGIQAQTASRCPVTTHRTQREPRVLHWVTRARIQEPRQGTSAAWSGAGLGIPRGPQFLLRDPWKTAVWGILRSKIPLRLRYPQRWRAELSELPRNQRRSPQTNPREHCTK